MFFYLKVNLWLKEIIFRKLDKIVKIKEESKNNMYDSSNLVISKLEDLSNILNFVKISIQKWRESLIDRFNQNFAFLNDCIEKSQNINLSNFFEISKSLQNIVHSEINKFFKIEKPESESKDSPSMYNSIVLPKMFNRSLSATQGKKKELKSFKSLNYRHFEIFVKTVNFNPSDLKINDVIYKNRIENIDIGKIRTSLKSIKNDRNLFISLVQLKVYLKNEIKICQEHKTNEINLVNSDIFSHNKTISIKRNSSKKHKTYESINPKTNTEKRYYELHDDENIETKNSQRALKLVKTSQKQFFRNPTYNSISSINSGELHVKDYEQRNLIKSHFSNDFIDPASPIFPNNRQISGNMLHKQNSIHVKTDSKQLDHMKNVLVKSYNSNHFNQLNSPKKMMLLSQKFGNYMCSARSLISQESGVFGKYNTSIIPYDDLGESLGVTEHKRMQRKLAMDRSQSKCARVSTLHHERQMNRDSSIGFAFNMTSKDLLSVDKNVSNSSNPFLLTSEVHNTHNVGKNDTNDNNLNNDNGLGLMNNNSNNKAITGNNRDNMRAIFNSTSTGQKIYNRLPNNKVVSKKPFNAHQKFASVNLDYLRLKTSKTDINALKSEISNLVEEEPKYHLNTKKNRSKNKKKMKAMDHILMMKSLIKRGINTNYSKILASGLLKSKTNKKKKSVKKKKKKMNFQTLQSNINNINYFNTNTFKSKVKNKKMSTRNKSNTQKPSRRRVKNTSVLKKKINKEKSIGNIPSLRIFPKQIKLKNDIKQMIVTKTKSKKGQKQISKLRKEKVRKSDIFPKQIMASSSTKFKNNIKVRTNNIHQKMKKFSSIIGKIKKPKMNVSQEKSYNHKSFKIKQQNQEFFKSKRKSEINGYHLDSNINHKISDKYLLNSGDPKRKKKKTNKVKNKLGHFFSYLGYTADTIDKKVRKKPTRKLKNALHVFSKKL